MSKLKLGINEVNNTEYHSDTEYLSSSNLKDLLRDIEKFHREKILKIPSPSLDIPALAEGSLVHAMLLEPETVEEEFAFWEGWRKVGKEWDEFKTLPENEGKTLISKPQLKRCEDYVKACKENPITLELLSGGIPEFTLVANIDDVPLKVRADYINIDKNYIVDVKTSGHSVELDTFKLTIKKYMYELSAALYCKVAEDYYKKPFDFYFIAVSKKDKECHVYKLSEETKTHGEFLIAEAMSIYKKCMTSGNWSGTLKEELMEDDYEVLEV